MRITGHRGRLRRHQSNFFSPLQLASQFAFRRTACRRSGASRPKPTATTRSCRLAPLDAGVELARNLVRLPIIGAGQSVLHLGAQLSNRLGVIAYEEKSIPFMRKQMHVWRVADSVVGIRSVEIPLPESTKNRDAMRERFIQVARELIDNHDAEIIVPMGVTMVPVQYSPQEFEKELGVPVMDALKTSIQTAEMMVRMNLTHSTKTYPRPPAS